MNEVCGDNRFEIIEHAKKMLIEATNIESRPEEMAVLDNILFRMWQMGWLTGCKHSERTCRIVPHGHLFTYHSLMSSVHGEESENK